MVNTSVSSGALPLSKPVQITKRWWLVPAALVALVASSGANAQAYINITAGGAFAPGVYGQIAIGNNRPPPVINAAPLIVGQPVYAAPPMYLHVGPEEYREWGRYCGRYNACGRPVYFVRVDEQNRWWENHNQHLRGQEYYRQPEPHFERGERGERRDEHRNEHRDERRNERRD